MSKKINNAHEHISGDEVATIIREFWEEFRRVYGKDVMESNLCAVGPLQSMIGLAIRNGHLRWTPTLTAEQRRERALAEAWGG